MKTDAKAKKPRTVTRESAMKLKSKASNSCFLSWLEVRFCSDSGWTTMYLQANEFREMSKISEFDSEVKVAILVVENRAGGHQLI